jgi:hypothetical protein
MQRRRFLTSLSLAASACLVRSAGAREAPASGETRAPTASEQGPIKIAVVRDAIPAYRFRTGAASGYKLSSTQPWQSAPARGDGTIVTWGSSSHDGDGENTVRVLDPLRGLHTKFPESVDGGRTGYPVSQYDNLNYFVITSEDKLVILDRGVYDLRNRSAGIHGWTHGTRGNTRYWPNGPHLTGLKAGDFMLPAENPPGQVYRFDDDVMTGRFNAGVCYLPAIDKAVIFGGTSGGSLQGDRIWLVERNNATSRFYVSSKPHRWRLAGIWINNDARFTIGGINPLRRYAAEMRDMLCAVGRHVYFVSPKTQSTWDPRGWKPWFWRLDVLSLSQSGDPKLTRLADVPALYATGRVGSSTTLQAVRVDQVIALEPDKWEMKTTPAPSSRFPLPLDGMTFLLQDAAGSQWLCFRSATRAQIFACKVAWLKSGVRPVAGAGRFQLWQPGARFGALTYDERAGYIVFEESKVGLWAYDPDDDGRGWIQLAPPGGGYRNGPFSNTRYSKASGKIYHRCADSRAEALSAYWSSVEILTKKPRTQAQPHGLTVPHVQTASAGPGLWSEERQRWAARGDGRLYKYCGEAPARARIWVCSLERDAQGRVLWEPASGLRGEQGERAGVQERSGATAGGGWLFDKRGEGWLGPGPHAEPAADGARLTAYRWRVSSEPVDGALARAECCVPAGNAACLDVDARSGGLLNGFTAYDPVDDCVISAVFTDEFSIELWRLNCTPDASGGHNWVRTAISGDFGAMMRPRFAAGAGQIAGAFGSQCIVDRKLYVAAPVSAVGSNGGYVRAVDGHSYRTHAFLCVIDLDTRRVERFLELPYSIGGYWSRGWDHQIDAPLFRADPSRCRGREVMAINRKVVVGPDARRLDGREQLNRVQPGDPMCMIYDVDADRWTLGEPIDMRIVSNPRGAQDTLYSSPGSAGAVPELNEFWVIQAHPALMLPHIRYRIA